MYAKQTGGLHRAGGAGDHTEVDTKVTGTHDVGAKITGKLQAQSKSRT